MAKSSIFQDFGSCYRIADTISCSIHNTFFKTFGQKSAIFALACLLRPPQSLSLRRYPILCRLSF